MQFSNKVHVLVYSALILVYDILSSYWSGFNPYFLDITLQICLILYVCGFPSQNGRRGGNPAPPAQGVPQPHWAEEQGRGEAAWPEDDIPVAAQEEVVDVVLDFNLQPAGPAEWPLEAPGLCEWLEEALEPAGPRELLDRPIYSVPYYSMPVHHTYSSLPQLTWPEDDIVPETLTETVQSSEYNDVWNDENCDDEGRYLCRFEALPQADRQGTVGQLVAPEIKLTVPTVT